MDIEENGVWTVTAKKALWRLESNPELPRLEVPEIGSEYAVQVEGGHLQKGDLVWIEYLPALVYFNGFDKSPDIEEIRICYGMVKEVFSGSQPSRNSKRNLNEITFQVQKTLCMRDFKRRQINEADKMDFWNYFRGETGAFYNIRKFDQNITLSWASDAYAGGDCIVQQEGKRFFAFYYHEWWDRDFGPVFCGRIIFPEWLANNVNGRLVKMDNRIHWSGDYI